MIILKQPFSSDFSAERGTKHFRISSRTDRLFPMNKDVRLEETVLCRRWLFSFEEVYSFQTNSCDPASRLSLSLSPKSASTCNPCDLSSSASVSSCVHHVWLFSGLLYIWSWSGLQDLASLAFSTTYLKTRLVFPFKSLIFCQTSTMRTSIFGRIFSRSM